MPWDEITITKISKFLSPTTVREADLLEYLLRTVHSAAALILRHPPTSNANKLLFLSYIH